MIIDELKNIEKYDLGKNFKSVLNFIKTIDFKSIESGKTVIDGDNAFALLQEYETIFKQDYAIEMHKKYADIHLMLEGDEKIGYAPISELEVLKEYDNINDYLLLKGNVDFTKIKKGMFAIYLPNEPHAPRVCIDKKQNVKKWMIKFRV